MKITRIKIHIVNTDNDKTLRGFADIVLEDCLRISGIKILRNRAGIFFIDMPNRRKVDRCPQCPCRNALQANYCNNCGVELSCDRIPFDVNGRPNLYAKIVTTLSADYHIIIEKDILTEFAHVLKNEINISEEDYGNR